MVAVLEMVLKKITLPDFNKLIAVFKMLRTGSDV